jgi:nicotinamidase-related amidase
MLPPSVGCDLRYPGPRESNQPAREGSSFAATGTEPPTLTPVPTTPERSILLIIDMVSDYDFPDADRLVEAGEPAVARIREARDAADEAGLRVVYANDIHDHWSCSTEQLCGIAMEGKAPELVGPLLPRSDDAFMHKGQHSAFYGTPLAHLLHEEGIEELVLSGQVTEQCVLYTALDAHVRHYAITVLEDAVVSLEEELGAPALRMMERNMGARIVTTDRWRAELA